MLIKEVREIIKNYSEDELRVLLSEIYKAIPKKTREEKDIDRMIQDIKAFKSSRKRGVRKKEKINIDELKGEVEEFIEYAYKQYYFAPNMYVPKKERPKWRFKARRFIKKLETITGSTEDFSEATRLLEEIYEVLCYAYHVVIFSGDDPFNSVGISQPEVFNKIIQRKFAAGIGRKSITSALKVMAVNKPNSQLIPVFMQYFKTPDSREIVIEQCNFLLQLMREGKSLIGNRLERKVNREYTQYRRINLLVETVFYCYLKLADYQKACDYFNENYDTCDDEIRLYALLKLLFRYHLKEYWISEYEKAVEKGVEPRDSLQKAYNYINEKDELPRWI